MNQSAITTLFCDIGGVLLTNGWARQSRKLASERFGYDLEEAETRHHLMFDEYEEGKISLHEYLQFVIFNKPRSFSENDYIAFMYEQSQPFDDMLVYVKELRRTHELKVVIVSNEGRELTDYRISRFQLRALADIFVVSSYVGIRKPDKAIFRLALDLAQARPEQVIYLDDRALFVEVAKSLDIKAIQHLDMASTDSKMQSILQAL